MQNIVNVLSDSPIASYSLLAGCILLLVLIVRFFTPQAPKILYQKFKNLDSNTLDANSQLCHKFYAMAVRYRAKHGKTKYYQYIVKHFEFFYEFHNTALRWIDEICIETSQSPVPKGFILSVIASGHIGKVVTNINYASGLPDQSLRTGDPIIFYRHNDSLEIWSHRADKPVCAILMGSAKVQNTHRQTEYITATMTGIDISGRKRYQLEVRFMCHNPVSGKWDDFVAIDRLNDLKEWIRKSAQTEIELPSDTGIHVIDHSSDQPVYNMHTPLTRTLERLKGHRVQAFFDINNASAFDDNTPINVIVLCRNIGIIAITERPEDGDIIYSGDPVWQQKKDKKIVAADNICIQATLAKHTLSNILYHAKLKRWPIYSLVVYSSRDVTLTNASGQKHLQCPVIKLIQLEKWLATNKCEENIQFSDKDINKFETVFSANQAHEPELVIE